MAKEQIINDSKQEASSATIGKKVEVIIDRPLGSEHPKHKGFIYPINYGYVEGIIGGDGEEQDVYILGENVPLKKFSGIVVAIIHRLNDNEDKWVAAAEGKSFTAEEIMQMVEFQEKYFRSTLIM